METRTHEKEMSAMLEDAHDLALDAEEEEEKGNIVLKSGKKQRYEIVKPIVAGNNSTVYLVNHLLKDGSIVKMAMKAENQGIKSESTGFALANEIRFLVEYQKRWRDQVHGCEHLLPICDYGHSKRYKFLIMPLLGPNLDQLREEMKKEFSPTTAARLSIQALEAVSMLHQIKILHTRIEPSHFCIGTEHQRNVLFLIGLGHIVTSSKTPTWNRKPQYSPRAIANKNLYNMELECWFFTLLDLFGRNELPWNKFKNMSKETIEERKLLMFNSVVAGPGNLHSRGSGLNVFPIEVRTICAIMNKQNYKVSDLRLQLIKLLNRANVGINVPFEWEETPEYLACKDIKFDMKQYKLNVEAIRECTKRLLKDYKPPPKDESGSQT
ncbi:unnamed protein product [Cylicocyclus nassatus]|uniref:Protein kinase domain-containing protein n=1 Tax=Cylicocyclus nassatus TaxID=53992 RepID=A0AA36MBG1_CYLNA|nr:unnamed protein product [Cylicocyclus nassatus]